MSRWDPTERELAARLDQVQLEEAEEQARLSRARRERLAREAEYVTRVCATCGWDVRAAASATHAECDAWSPCRGAWRALEHDARCACPECRPCCAETTCREHASEAEIEERSARVYARMHGVTP